MGDAERADPTSIRRFPQLTDTAYAAVFGYFSVKAHYQLINDNLLDLSHTQYVHPMLSREETPADALAPLSEFGHDGETIWERAVHRNVTPLPFAAMLDGRARVDNWVDTYWHAPSVIHLDIGTRAPGASRWAGGDVATPSFHLLTPETETSTHYFWSLLRNVQLDDEALSQAIYAGLDQAFAVEDRAIIEMQQRELGEADLMSLRPVVLETDRVAVGARRVIKQMLEAEAS